MTRGDHQLHAGEIRRRRDEHRPPLSSPFLSFDMPFPCLHFADLNYVMAAGKHISVTHVAGTVTKFMGIGAQHAVATASAAALCLRHGKTPCEIGADHPHDLRRTIAKVSGSGTPRSTPRSPVPMTAPRPRGESCAGSRWTRQLLGTGRARGRRTEIARFSSFARCPTESIASTGYANSRASVKRSSRAVCANSTTPASSRTGSTANPANAPGANTGSPLPIGPVPVLIAFS
jgi:hypothetical protein